MALLVIRTAYLPPIEVDLSPPDPDAQPNPIVRALRPQIALYTGAGTSAPLVTFAPAGAPPAEWSPIPLLALAALAVLGVWLILR